MMMRVWCCRWGDSFSRSPVCPYLSHQNDGMHKAMTAAVSSPKNCPRPGLVRGVDQGGTPLYVHTSVPCMPCEEAPRIMGDMPDMPGTIEVALALPDHAKWR